MLLFLPGMLRKWPEAFVSIFQIVFTAINWHQDLDKSIRKANDDDDSSPIISENCEIPAHTLSIISLITVNMQGPHMWGRALFGACSAVPVILALQLSF